MEKLERYRRGIDPLPKRMLAWPLYGAGLESLGRDGKPVESPVPKPGLGELLVRHDAVGLCYSDIKIIRAGGNHPRLYGRDLAQEPIIQGHEVALTVVSVGENLHDEFQIGQRFVVQADIYYEGMNLAYGYMLPGGLAQYGVIGKEILRGDEGLYLIPVRETTGYAEAALTEPWACVEAAYSIPHRAGPKDGGLLWAVGNGAAGEYRLGGDVRPRRAVLSNVPESLAAELREQGGRFGFEVIETNDDDYAALWQRQTDGHGFDDIIVLGSASAELVEQVESFIGRLGVIVLVAAEPLNRKVVVDVGRIHYDYFQHVGTTGREVLAAYRLNTRSELKAGGSVWFVGAAGPMGHMHVQRAIETTNGARAIVATDLVATRIGELIDKFAEPAKAKGIRLVTLTVEELGPETYHARLCQEAGPGGFDDIVVLAPAARAVAEAGEYLGEGGVLNIFAGLPRGTKATLDLSGVYLKNQRLHGSSGSTIDDLRRMLKKTESGALSTNRSVYAISGMHGVRDGFEAVIEGRFAGKVVVFPSIADLGLMPLVELKEKLPKVYAKLDGGRTWTNEAEEELLRELLPEGGEDA